MRRLVMRSWFGFAFALFMGVAIVGFIDHTFKLEFDSTAILVIGFVSGIAIFLVAAVSR